MQDLPNIHRLPLPLKGNPLGFVNSYLLKTDEGCMLIDVGWNSEDSFEALRSQLSELGVNFSDLRYIVITHVHPDHYGLVGRLKQLTDARLVIHELEQSLVDSRYVDYDSLLGEMDEWLKINGVPKSDRPTITRASLEVLGLVTVAVPDLPVCGGEHLVLSDFDLEVLWTPGHSPGHICLYERSKKLLFSGDHVLPKITPNVSMTTQTVGNPLVDYENSLRQIAKLPVDLILPAHGDPFEDLEGRVSHILRHHDHRLAEMKGLFHGEPKTAYEIAALTKWFTRFEELPPFQRRVAVTETLAHLEFLVTRGELTKFTDRGLVWYSPAN